MSKVLIIGGGAAGMMAAVMAAREGGDVCLYEKNEKLGKKLFITGKGRCNITNACEAEDFFTSVVTNPKFLYSSFYGFTNQDVINFFEEIGVATKTERGERVFPASDHSSDVIRGLEREMKRLHVRVFLNTEVRKVEEEAGRFRRLVLSDGTSATADTCIVTTGGLSYRTTGSTGDGYRFAEELGHRVCDCLPALVPIEVKEGWAAELQGLSLKNVTAAVYDGGKKLYDGFGEMLFTHFGVSGPLILSASSYINSRLAQKELKLSIDLKPALTEEQLDQRVQRDFLENANRQFKNALGKLFPARLIPVIVRLGGIDADKQVNSISRAERQDFVYHIKHLELTLTKVRGFCEAIITKGGICLKEIDPGTMESKLVKGLYFAGEVLDVDALTGGFNLQIAWSTACAAGRAAAADRENV